MTVPLIDSRLRAGFRRAYWGYIMGQHYTQSRSTAVCVDANAIPYPTSEKGNQNGALLYPTQTLVGAPGYNNNWEMTCAVCEGMCRLWVVCADELI
jgi:hypothetical protein